MLNRFFGQNLQKEGLKEKRKKRKKKKEHHRRLLHLRNNLGTKFQLKLTISNFWTKVTQKEYFQSKKK